MLLTTAVLVHLVLVATSLTLIGAERLSRRTARPAPAGPGPRMPEVYEAAFLAGGPGRVADTALAVMHTDGRLVIGGPGIVSVAREVAGDPVEREVIECRAAAPDGSLATLRRAVAATGTVQGIGDSLAARGLMAPAGRGRARARAAAVAQRRLCATAIPVAVAVTAAARAGDWPRPGTPFAVLVLPVLIAGLVAGSFVARRAGSRLTAEGEEMLADGRKRHRASYDPARTVALKGPRAVPDPAAGALLIAAAAIPLALAAAPAAATAAVAAPVWCGGGGGSGCGAANTANPADTSATADPPDSASTADTTGGDGGDGDGASCGGCGGCGCG
ncbi:TIGR04222 domain-containing membrane protein [Streptomyces sp. CAU 1734]|uniref:TIGR04222 domain-containing membrane protein n=1 Tax=Streptomyces sp. CAU 1734 TaxID=3140360 RepID=UPI003261B736